MKEVTIGKSRLINGDCLEVMDELIAKGVVVDAIITDPPYGNMDTDGGRKLGIENWDKKIKPNEIFLKSNELLRKNGRLILFTQDPYTYELQTGQIPNLPYNYKMIWLKDNFANALGCNKNPVYFTEDILIFTKKECYNAVHPLRRYMKSIAEIYGFYYIIDLFAKEGRYTSYSSAKVHATYKFGYGEGMRFDLMDKKLFDYMSSYIKFGYTYDYLKEQDSNYKKQYSSTFNLSKNEKYKSNILQYKKDYEGLHPTQKPVLLIEDLIKTYTNECDTVLDFTAGSFTTGIACQNLNRNFIGIELDEDYFNIGAKRMQENYKEEK